MTTNLALEVHGEADRTFVWGHGLTGSRRADDESGLFDFAPAAVAAGWRAVRYDARGHGRSPAPLDAACYRWERLADDMLAVADEVEANRFVAGGASMGCATSLFAALAAPERVWALVLAIPPTAWETRAAQREVYETMASIVETKGVDRLVELSRRQPPSTMFGVEGQERSLRNLAAMDAAALPAVLRGAASSDLPPPEVLARITVPVLVLAWADDPGHPLSTAERLVDALPDATLQVAHTPDAVHEWPGHVATFLSHL